MSSLAKERYATIVADPPWRYKSPLPAWGGKADLPLSAVPYPTLSVDEIASLQVRDLAAPDSHLYLWTTNTHLRDAWRVVEAWGFKYSTLLVWCKPPHGFAAFPTYNSCTEFVLFCKRGSLGATERVDRNYWEWPRGEHSRKPDAFLDLVERVSPGPRLELFARRQRLGWDTWGNEALAHVEMAS